MPIYSGAATYIVKQNKTKIMRNSKQLHINKSVYFGVLKT